jgi:hypothetical protein
MTLDFCKFKRTVVWIPSDVSKNDSRYWFKVKGAEHSKSAAPKLATVDVEKFANIEKFLDNVLDEGRLEQGITKLKEAHKEVSIKSTGEYLKWLISDVLKESKQEMIESGLTESDVTKNVQIRGRKWYFDRLNKE